ncbi:MAG: acetyl-CoA carboxylase carboxyltransferase subunit alpha [Pyrinomonadaceae bacterium]
MSELTAIEKVRLARHQLRPHTLDLIEHLFDDFLELHGDRRYADDAAMISGLARLGEYELMVIGQQKGRNTKERHHRNFGMPKPEGYRKALRLMRQAEKFGRGIVTFIDTSGAYPGIDAEERGQAEAIATNLREMSNLSVPIVVVVLGEGGSGGALAIGVGDRILMLENSVYSVITPEGCAAILWKDAGKADLAAENLRLTAGDLERLKLIDEIIAEPAEWNAADAPRTALALQPLKEALSNNLAELFKKSVPQLLENRWNKFRRMGHWQQADSF